MHIRKNVLVVLAMAALSIAHPAKGTEYYVDAAQPDNSGDGLSWATAKQTIQAAIDSSSTNDTVWVADGAYNIGGAVGTGQSLTNRVCIDKAITVQSVNGPEFTIIEGASGSNGSNDVDSIRGVYMTDGAILSGFTVTNGYTMDYSYSDDGRGGGLFMTTDGMATNCTLSGNSAFSGGGASGGTLNNCTLSGNSAVNSGGGSYNATLNYCMLSGNSTAYRGGGASGGTLNYCALNNNSSADDGGGATQAALNNCTLSNNTAADDGGGSYFGPLNNCILSGNSAGGSGGGAHVGTLNNCTLSGNSAAGGGGAYNGTLNNCTLSGNSAAYSGGGAVGGTLNNCTLNGNSAVNDGGGSSQATLNNCTLSGNWAVNYGGGASYGTLNNCTVSGNSADQGGGASWGTLNNCIVWGNSAENYNDAYGGSASYSCASDITAGVNSCITNAPFFVNSAIGRFELQAQSPCINAGTNLYASGDTDLAGNPRIIMGTIDMGAYESPDIANSFMITTTAGSNGEMVPANPIVFETYDQPISILPAFGYYVESLTVDGIPQTPSVLHIFNDVQTTHTIAATFATDPHALTVENGTGDGSYIIGTEVAVVADAAEDGYVFFQWTTDPASYSSSLSDPYSASTTLTMPETNIVLTANYIPYLFYVDAAQSDDSGDGLSWNTAKKTIQAAIDIASPGGIVWVTNGTYNIGGAVATGQTLTNRVCINKAITVQSVNGLEFTIIEGASGSNGSNDVDSIRGVYIADGAKLAGFTVTNGHTMFPGSGFNICGGGIFLKNGGMATNCTLEGNSAGFGGGAYGGKLNNCTVKGNSAEDGGGTAAGTLNSCILTENTATRDGGGASGGTLNNCILTGNTAINYGGGAAGGFQNNCTISDNSATTGGGTHYGTLSNCIVWGNFADNYNDVNGYNDAYSSYSCASDITAGVNGCITNEPHFANSVMGRFDLLADSSCINAGNNVYASGDTDLSGDPRIVAGTVDMGAYESPDITTHYLIATSPGANGAIEPANPLVFEGYDQPVSILPAFGYYVESLTVDGIPQAPSETHTFNNVQTTHAVEATFATSPHTLTVENGTGDGSYIIRIEVNVVADAAPSGLVFRRWETEPAQYISAVGNLYNAATTFTMPESNVVLTAIYGVAYYVDAARPDDSGDGLSWATAKQTIQAAVDLTDDIGCTVWVTNGTYNIGGAVATGQVLTNRVCINKAMTVRSVNGPEVTIIEGASGSNGSRDVDAVRGVYIADGATLSGFTVTNGYTGLGYDNNGSGGGAFMEPYGSANNCIMTGNSAYYGGGAYGGTLTDCALSKNSANSGGGAYSRILINCSLNENTAYRGGGSYWGMLYNCTLVGNSASYEGGGANNSTLNNCRLSDNRANYFGGGSSGGILNNCVLTGNWAQSYGGGSYHGTLNNCTISGNSGARGGGSYYGTLNNCIVWDNFAPNNKDTYGGSASYSCASDITADVDGCITNDPSFANSSTGNLNLLANSPCINAGNNADVSAEFDLAGNPRVVAGIVDIGAYETPDLPAHRITTTVEGMGTITPANPLVFEGSDLEISILPSLGYYMTSLMVNGNPEPPAETYTFYNIQTTQSVSATFATDPHTLTVENGTGDGSYIVSTEVNVVADDPENGFIFVRWTTDPSQYVSGLNDPNQPSTIFSMPESNVVLTATYGPIFCYADSLRPDDSGDGLSWSTAKQTIQAAVDLVEPSGVVWVTNGTYNIGGKAAVGSSQTNRVCINKAITVQSVNGPEVTIIEGTQGLNSLHDSSSIRGAYIADGAILSGFTVTNGYTISTSNIQDQKGGGIFLESNGMATNCIITGNESYGDGGGSCYGTLIHCTIIGNKTRSTRFGLSGNGGGSYYGTLYNCILSGNSAWDGGGSFQGTLNNCTLIGNSAGYYGGGSYYGTLNNCIVWDNSALSGDNTYNVIANYTYGGDPLFVDAANGDYSLQTNSPCINAGNNAYISGNTDLAGDARIVYGVVDMGAYEFSGPITGTPDFDNDGLDDTWEGIYFDSTVDCDPNGHSDSDPFSNQDEYIAGTDPTDGASLFAITNSGQAAQGFQVEWDAVSNRLYSVRRASSPTNAFQTLQSGIAYPQSSYTDTNVLDRVTGFYRLEVQMQE